MSEDETDPLKEEISLKEFLARIGEKEDGELGKAMAALAESEGIGRPPAADDAEPASCDPLRTDARDAPRPRDFARKVEDRLDDIEWRIIARDKQARARELQEDLAKSPAAYFAEHKAKAKRRAARRARKEPQSAQAVKRVLGRLLARCEAAMEEVWESGPADVQRPAQFGLAVQIAHAAAHLARTMGQIDGGVRQTRHTVRVERGRPETQR
jgi:hypothetical protein